MLLDADVIQAVQALGGSELPALGPSKLAALLRFLVDELLDTDAMREVRRVGGCIGLFGRRPSGSSHIRLLDSDVMRRAGRVGLHKLLALVHLGPCASVCVSARTGARTHSVCASAAEVCRCVCVHSFVQA